MQLSTRVNRDAATTSLHREKNQKFVIIKHYSHSNRPRAVDEQDGHNGLCQQHYNEGHGKWCDSENDTTHHICEVTIYYRRNAT
jgi:hypothetical protein